MNKSTAYITLRSRERLDGRGVPSLTYINGISVKDSKTVIELGYNVIAHRHSSVDQDGFYYFYWILRDFCIGSILDDYPGKFHDWEYIVNLPINEINCVLGLDNGDKMDMVLVSFWITENENGFDTPYHFNNEIIDKYNEREKGKKFSHDIAEEFAQFANLDCPSCLSTKVETTGTYRNEGTGFYVDVRCKNCKMVSECGDGEFLSEVAEFNNGQFFPIERVLYRKLNNFIDCPHCKGKTMQGIIVNGRTYLWICEECPNITFEYSSTKNIEDMDVYLSATSQNYTNKILVEMK